MNDQQIEHLSKVRHLSRDLNRKRMQVAAAQQEMAMAFVIGTQLGISGADLSRAAEVSRQRVSQILQENGQVD